MISFLSAKGGVGCSVVAAAAAVLAAEEQHCLLVDCCGDQAALLGLDGEAPFGLSDWLDAEAPLPDALRRIETPISDRLSLLGLGQGPFCPRPDQARDLAHFLGREGRQVVVDVGGRTAAASAILDRSQQSFLVTRACYLALRAALRAPIADGAVVVVEPGRALRSRDVEAALDSRVVAEIPWDPRIARAVDAGLLLGRVPQLLRRLEPVLTGSRP